MLNQSNALLNLEASFLDLKSKAELNKTCRTVSHLVSPQLRQSRAEKLLDHVLNIDEKRKKEILALLQSPDRGPRSFMLMPANGQVKYQSSKQGNQIVPRATYNNMSPLEAAAACGDFHLVKLFEQALPPEQKHKAGQQLKTVITSPNFLSAFKTLQSAYHTYLNRFWELYSTGDSSTRLTLWGQVCEAQKNLSNFGLNVFCNPIPHHPLPDFTQEPQRSIRITRESVHEKKPVLVELDLDSFGEHTKLGLCKIDYKDSVYPCHGSIMQATQDSKAIDLLCEVLSPELGKITERLLSYPKPKGSESELPAVITDRASASSETGLNPPKRLRADG